MNGWLATNPTVTEYHSKLALSHYNSGLRLCATGHPDDG